MERGHSIFVSPNPHLPYDPIPQHKPIFLGKFTSVLGLLGAALFFAGWIYRWSYFYFFQLELNTLDLPAQSFLIVPLQIFLGMAGYSAKTAVFLFSSPIPIQATLWLIKIVSDTVTRPSQSLSKWNHLCNSTQTLMDS